MKRLPLCKFPTTIFLVDDEPDLLSSLETLIEFESLKTKAFSCPVQGLTELNAALEEQKSILKGSSEINPVGIDNVSSALNISKLYEESYDPKRFDLISTVVVDFEMPGMNGLEFCQKINNPYVQKILLTGVVDDSDAIEAFNNGLIDGFVKKQDPNLVEKLTKTIHQATENYFIRHSRALDRSLRAVSRDYAPEDATFVDFFRGLCQDHGIVEYYLCQSTGTFLLIDKKQQLFCLFTKPQDLLEFEAEELSDILTKPDILASLQSKENMLCFHSVEDESLPPEGMAEKYIFPAVQLKGSTDYYVSMMPNIIPVDQNQVKHFQGGI